MTTPPGGASNDKFELDDTFAQLAHRAGAYYDELHTCNLPQALAEQLVRDWHLIQISRLTSVPKPADSSDLPLSVFVSLDGEPRVVVVQRDLGFPGR